MQEEERSETGSGGPRFLLIVRASHLKQGLKTPQIRLRPEPFPMRLQALRMIISVSVYI